MSGVDPRDLADALMDRPAFVRRYKPSVTVSRKRWMIGFMVHDQGGLDTSYVGFSIAVGPVLLNLLWTDRDAHEAARDARNSTVDAALHARANKAAGSLSAADIGALKALSEQRPLSEGGKLGDRITIRRPPVFGGVKPPEGIGSP